MKFPDKLKFKEFDLVTTGYNEKIPFKVNLPINVPWVKYEGCLGKMYTGFVYYWTIIPNTFNNKRELLKYKTPYLEIYKFKNYLLLVLDDTPIIPELKTVDGNYFKTIWKDLVFTDIATISPKIQVASVYTLMEVFHPKDVKIRIIDYCNVIGEERCSFQILNYNLLNNSRSCKTLISWGDKGDNIFREALMRFCEKMFETKYTHYFNWVLEDISKCDEFFNQFKC